MRNFSSKGSDFLAVRALESRDIESILAIQFACPEIAQWTAHDYERVVRGEMNGWISANANVAHSAPALESPPVEAVLPPSRDVNGFLVARRVATEVEILNFAVRPDVRRAGVGAALLQTVMQWARSSSAEQAILEVRSANQTALRFYERHKFQIVGRRRNYYGSPTDDALLLAAQIK
jgi:ribosomal-protein-alanine acetyltransferase